MAQAQGGRCGRFRRCPCPGVYPVLRDHPADCWPDVVPAFRDQFEDVFDTVVPPVLEIEDPLIRKNLIDHIDEGRPKEKAVLEQLAVRVDPERDQLAVKRMAKKEIESVNKTLRERSIPEKLRPLVAVKRKSSG